MGDHLRKVRLDRGLSQLNVAKILRVKEDSVTGWELNRYEPTAKLARAIIAFLGYFPFMVDNCSFGKQLYHARLITGKTQKEVSDLIGCDESNLRSIELDLRKPFRKTREKIEKFIQVALQVLARNTTPSQAKV